MSHQSRKNQAIYNNYGTKTSANRHNNIGGHDRLKMQVVSADMCIVKSCPLISTISYTVCPK